MLKDLDRWLLPYLFRRRPPKRSADVHLILGICDHFEPFHDTDKNGAMKRVARWAKDFPKLASTFVDSEGIAPKHTFFYPIEQYDSDILGVVSDLCHSTGCETEIHLHHDNDTTETLGEALEKGKADLSKHGLLSRSKDGEVRFGFIHGNWALDNSHPTGRHCGVSGELAILRKAGCYADFTLPSAPSPTQTKTLNSIYYAESTSKPMSHNRGIPASRETSSLRLKDDHLLLIQGPLGLNWRWRKAGIFPRIENGDLTGANPPTANRLQLWLDLGIHVQGHPNVVFAKLHTHGALPRNSDTLLGAPMYRFHEELSTRAKLDPQFHYHYVTAREMANIIYALEEADPDQLPVFAKARKHSILPASPD